MCNNPRRGFIKRGAYAAPTILTLAVAPQYAKASLDKVPDPGKGNGGVGNGNGNGNGVRNNGG